MTTTVTIITGTDGEPHVHAAGCADLRKRHYHGEHGWNVDVDSLDDVTYELWGASGVATDDYVDGKTCFDADATPDELAAFRAYTIAEYSTCHRVFPCVHLPTEGATS